MDGWYTYNWSNGIVQRFDLDFTSFIMLYHFGECHFNTEKVHPHENNGFKATWIGINTIWSFDPLIIYKDLPVLSHSSQYYWLVLCDTVLHKNLTLLNFQSTFNKAFNLRTIEISLVKLEQICSGIVTSRKTCLWSSGDIVTMVSLQLWHNKE